MRLVSVSVALILTIPGSILAQELPPQPRFYVAGAVELARFTGFLDPYAGRSGLGVGLQAGYTRPFGRFGVRVGLAYHERAREYDWPAFGSFPASYRVSTFRTVAANVDLTYDLTRSRIRPYLIGGLAPYWVASSERYDDGRRARYTALGMAASPGLGLQFPLRNVQLFAETRVYLFGASSHVFWPVTFGVRF